MESSPAGKRLLVSAALLVFSGANAMAYEEPDYTVISENDGYELRQYTPYIVAETTANGDFRSAGKKAFRILAGYIFGDNRSATRMDMTVPVESQASAEPVEMAMTTPVMSELTEQPESTDDSYVYRFVMESKYTLETLPVPNDPRVAIRRIEPRTVAVKRFSGFWSEGNVDKHETRLLEQLREDGLKTIGEPKLARYNGPFTPWFLRRNEIMVEVGWPDS